MANPRMVALRRVNLPLANLRMRRATALHTRGTEVIVDLDALDGAAPLRLTAAGVVAWSVQELLGAPLVAGIAITPPHRQALDALAWTAPETNGLIFVALDDERDGAVVRRLQLLARDVRIDLRPLQSSN
ncbi:MAG TPA: hypothetical protein VF883_25290 [Thermoanaerobaculia bacterium]|jgi:hypothetical protein